jgi:hypothetical protein
MARQREPARGTSYASPAGALSGKGKVRQKGFFRPVSPRILTRDRDALVEEMKTKRAALDHIAGVRLQHRVRALR